MGYESTIHIAYPFGLGYEVGHVDTDGSFTLHRIERTHEAARCAIEVGLTVLRSYNVVAMIDLSKVGNGPVGQLLDSVSRGSMGNQDSEPRPAIYGSDGDTLIFEDSYGDRLSVIGIEDLQAALSTEVALGAPPYRRFVMADALLNSIDSQRWPESLVALHFGH